MANKVQIRLKIDQLKALYKQYGIALSVWTPDNAHEILLKEIALELHLMMGKKDMHAKKHTLTLTPLHAAGFYQLWQMFNAQDEYTWVIINQVLEKIDKQHKEPQKLLPKNVEEDFYSRGEGKD